MQRSIPTISRSIPRDCRKADSSIPSRMTPDQASSRKPSHRMLRSSGRGEPASAAALARRCQRKYRTSSAMITASKGSQFQTAMSEKPLERVSTGFVQTCQSCKPI